MLYLFLGSRLAAGRRVLHRLEASNPGEAWPLRERKLHPVYLFSPLTIVSLTDIRFGFFMDLRLAPYFESVLYRLRHGSLRSSGTTFALAIFSKLTVIVPPSSSHRDLLELRH
jgi:hypothetical protein